MGGENGKGLLNGYGVAIWCDCCWELGSGDGCITVNAENAAELYPLTGIQ